MFATPSHGVKVVGAAIGTGLLLWGTLYALAYFTEETVPAPEPHVEAPAAIATEVVAEEVPLPPEIPAFVDTTDPNELVPDLVPLPARDLKIEKNEAGEMMLYFSTTYYNQGRGPLELRVDDEATNIRSDIDRSVMQRIYDKEDGYRDIPVGTFLWHQEHLHYHFDAFVEYDLASVDDPSHTELEGSRIKSTFCLRDISKVDIELPDRKEIAEYEICGKRLQGVSVGWGDTYYWDYPAQNMNVSSLKSGTYTFTTRVNPSDVLEEINYKNNISVVTFKIDMEAGTLEVLEEMPSTTPAVEHIHLDDPFGM